MEVGSEGNSIGAPPAAKPEWKATFKEKFLGATEEGPKKIRNLVDDRVMKLNLMEGNRRFHVFCFDPKAYAEICKPWEDCLGVKLIGKDIGYGALCEKLRLMWKLSGGYEVKDVHHGYFLVMFDLAEDKCPLVDI